MPFIRRRDGYRIEGCRYAALCGHREDASPQKAVGVWFPDLPGCFSAGDDVDEALRNASEAIELYPEEIAKDGCDLPRPRTVSELRSDARVAEDPRGH
ncbi:MAG TPA: type II toxin-antitoxin system HicB family antitoxin [Xanthobacteraceae bacterium]